VPDTQRENLQQNIADALVASHERCVAASASMFNGDAHVEESRMAIARSRALLLRAAEGTRAG
jgi:hypothetical protein